MLTAEIRNHLEQKITQFFAKMVRILLIDTRNAFPGFFNEVWAKRFMGLDPIPGTAVRRSEFFHQRFKITENKTPTIKKSGSGNDDR